MLRGFTKKEYLLFDLDGTLYHFKGGSYSRSGLRKEVHKRAIKLISKKTGYTKAKSKRILISIIKKYGEDISIGLERQYSINRYSYFNSVWNIPAKLYVTFDKKISKTLHVIARHYRCILISDAPSVWIHNVLRFLKIEECFKNRIYSGEGNIRKGFGNAFNQILKQKNIKPENCITIGDQEKTDIIPAKKIGIKTILISRRYQKTKADFQIKNFSEILNIVIGNS